jgi:Uma2 family endonuclease
LQAKPGGYRDAHPTAADVLLLIEVSDTTLRYDLNVKARLYAAHEIPEYWVVDLAAKRVWRHRRPGASRYEECTEIASGNLAIPGGLGAIDVAELL